MNKELLHYYKASKKSHRKAVSRFFLMDMFYQNIQSLFDDRWEMELTSSSIYVRIKDEDSMTLDKFDKFIKKLAIAFNKEPYMYIGTSMAEATFYLYPYLCEKDSNYSNMGIALEVSVGNNEKCDFVETVREVREMEPTGYCKALKEKKYLKEYGKD